MLTLDHLTAFYNEYLTANGLEKGCALEHLMASDLTQEQRKWLSEFVAKWDEIADAPAVEMTKEALTDEYRELLIDALDSPERDALREGRAVANDFMDANMLMLDAFRTVFGRELITDDGVADDDMAIVNHAMAEAEKSV